MIHKCLLIFYFSPTYLLWAGIPLHHISEIAGPSPLGPAIPAGMSSPGSFPHLIKVFAQIHHLSEASLVTSSTAYPPSLLFSYNTSLTYELFHLFVFLCLLLGSSKPRQPHRVEEWLAHSRCSVHICRTYGLSFGCAGPWTVNVRHLTGTR